MTSAQAALRQAEETLAAEYGSLLLPNLDGNLSAARTLFPGQTIPGGSIPSSIFNTFGASITLAYTLDFFWRFTKRT